MATTFKASTGFSGLFKIRYDALSNALWMSGATTGDAFHASIPKTFDQVGDKIRMAIQVSYGGSVSLGELGEAANGQLVNPEFDAMSIYARLDIDRRTMKQSKGNAAAFVDSLGFEVENKVKNTARVETMMLYNNDVGVLGQFGAAATGTAAAPVITILDTTSGNGSAYRWRPHFWEEDEIVEIEKDVAGTAALQASLFKITAVNPSTKQVTLARLSGSVDLTNAGYNSQLHNVLIQKSSSLNNSRNYATNARRAPLGILGCMNFTSGSRYTVAYQRRFASTVTNASSVAISPDVLIDEAYNFESSRGEFPAMCVCSYKQFTALLKYAEGSTIIERATVQGAGPVKFSFPGLRVLTAKGDITVVSSRFLRDDVIFYTIPNKHKIHYTGPFSWFEDDGTMLLRKTDDDAYEARYGGYFENFLHPFYFHFVNNLP